STTKSFGVATPGDRIDAFFMLANRGNDSIRILGCNASCNCVIPNDLPFTLGPSEKRKFFVSIHMPTLEQMRTQKSTHLDLALTLFTSNPAQSRIRLSLKGEVLNKTS